MTLTEILLLIILVLLIVNLILTITKKSGNNSDELKSEMSKTNTEITRIDPLIRSEFSNSREEIQRGAKTPGKN